MPSKSRGLRTSTGCLTCRKRRVKCDEDQPRCKNCERVGRDCLYPEKSSASQRPRPLNARRAGDTPSKQEAAGSSASVTDDGILELSTASSHAIGPVAELGGSGNGLAPGQSCETTSQSWMSFPTEQQGGPIRAIPDVPFLLDDDLFNFGDDLTLNLGPVEWFDLLAEDAINNMQDQPQGTRWNFDINSLSRRQSPRPSLEPGIGGIALDNATTEPTTIHQPWNTETAIGLSQDELIYFEHFINTVAPILDLFDSGKHFARVVPHLALYNVGLLKSVLAVGACHMASMQHQSSSTEDQTPVITPASISNAPITANTIAEQYYFETLQYLSQNLLHEAYKTSHEILTTGTMICIYEMFGTVVTSDHSNWDRHLRGAFWIQKTMGVSGESSDGLSRAIWWAWLRQDVWAAFRTGRPTLTIHQPKTPISELSPDELATRIIYITAKCVQFAATPKEGDIAAYIEAGENLSRMLDLWKSSLPQSFQPIQIVASHEPQYPGTEGPDIPPIWIHPPAHAAAIQMYHFARIIMILNQPSTGGLNMYQTRFKLLRESTVVACGIAIARQSQNLPSAFVSFQAVYAAALCAETQDRQREVLTIFDNILALSQFPSRSILNDLLGVWSGAK
ncbi:fungal-specific transcription factor domain-containing protein [Phaeosphaeria sp. MPI-PUGE-AT-0046c]|nr:fungal-specific transcription factor domain-containing protein [Phaeosphaeria sp. MPI-PUGE-AT-0046c]